MKPKPENMTEPCGVLQVEDGTGSSTFVPIDRKAIFFIDDHGNKWVRIKVRDTNNISGVWHVFPLNRVLRIVQ